MKLDITLDLDLLSKEDLQQLKNGATECFKF